jgi:hypothetical protein
MIPPKTIMTAPHHRLTFIPREWLAYISGPEKSR